jgi:hypothetical protein
VPGGAGAAVAQNRALATNGPNLWPGMASGSLGSWLREIFVPVATEIWENFE